MDISRFRKDSPGRLVQPSGGYWAFIPDPLPRELQLRTETWNALSKADLALGELAGAGRQLPNPHLLISPFLRREAVLSSRIEGTVTGIDQLLQFEADPTVERQTPDVREVRNYVLALEYGLDRHPEQPLSLLFIRQLHGMLLEGVRGEAGGSGEFRTEQNAVRQKGQSFEDARYVPPPPEFLPEVLERFEAYLLDPPELPLIVRMSLAHYQFEAIHPFMDGNGRIGRLLVSLLACEHGPLPSPLLYLSAYLEKNRDAYADHLLSVSQSGDWEGWIRYFADGVAQQSRDALTRASRMIDLWQRMRSRMQAAGRSATVLRLIDEFFAAPYLTVGDARDRLDVTSKTARRNIQKLVDAGILTEVTGNPRNQVLAAHEIVQIIAAENIQNGNR